MNLQQIIIDFDLDKKEVGQRLFPDNKYPGLALKRVLKEGLTLDGKQLESLSEMTGQSVNDLLNAETWTNKGTKEGIHTFEKESYVAELDSNTMITRIYHKGKRVHEELISAKAIKLSDYFTMINNVLKKIENEN